MDSARGFWAPESRVFSDRKRFDRTPSARRRPASGFGLGPARLRLDLFALEEQCRPTLLT
jgi:hypothetical protein